MRAPALPSQIVLCSVQVLWMRRQRYPAVVVRSGRVSAYASVRFPARSTPHGCSRSLDLTPPPSLHCLLSTFTGPDTCPDSIKQECRPRSDNRWGACVVHKDMLVSRAYDV
jgi:hypothetical protein